MPVRTLCADPPWGFDDALPGKGRGAARQYEVMGVGAICAFDLPPLADDALLFLWRVTAMSEEAMLVARAWGFVPKAEIVWVKTGVDAAKLHFGMGHYVRASHETCIIASRGKGSRLVQNRSTRSVLFAPVPRDPASHKVIHSAKPKAFYELVEKLAPAPRCELFARTRREGWLQYGLESHRGVAVPRKL